MSQFHPEDSQGTQQIVSNQDVILESDRDQTGAGDIVFRSGGVERARINNAGVGTGLLGGSLPVFNVKLSPYGAVGDGTTDDSTAVIAAIQAAYDAGGGTVYFPKGTYRIDSQLVIPNDGATPPKNRPIRLIGCAPAQFDGTFTDAAPTHGSILDLRSTTTPGKIDTRGTGTLEMQGLTLTQAGSAADTNPFVHTTNTALRITNCRFQGHSTLTGTTCVQDAVILGGTTNSSGSGAQNWFGGYGTLIDDNYFARIKRGIVLQAAANACFIRNNVSSFTCGAADSSGFIEINPNTGTARGNYIAGNLIEANHYTYCIRVIGTGGGSATQNTFVGNTFWDNGVSTFCYRLEGAAEECVILGIYSDGPQANWVSDALNTTANFYVVARDGIGNPTFRGSAAFKGAVTVDGTAAVAIQPTGAITVLTVKDDASSTSNVVMTVGDTAHGHWDFQNAGAGVARRVLKGYDNASNNTIQLDPSGAGKLVLGASGPNLSNVGGALMASSALQKGLAAPAYSASITPNAAAGDWQTIVVTNATAFTVNAPTNPPDGSHTQTLVIEISNTSGGAMGAITWNGAFKLVGGAFTNPATGNKRYVRFQWNGAAWVEQSRATADYT